MNKITSIVTRKIYYKYIINSLFGEIFYIKSSFLLPHVDLKPKQKIILFKKTISENLIDTYCIFLIYFKIS